MTETYQSALIVGAGSGLSASVARAFAKAGMQIALAARMVDKLGPLAKETNAQTYACDASQRAGVIEYPYVLRIPPEGLADAIVTLEGHQELVA